jgi:hypothetical protein
MQLYPLTEVTPNHAGLVCRQGRLMASVSTPIMALILGGAPVFWWLVGAPWPVWGLCALLAVVVVPLLIGDLLSKFRATNWLLWVRPDGLWINFRSYQDRGPTDKATVIHLPYDKIADVRHHRESYTTPSSAAGGSTHWKVHSLDIRLKQPDDGELHAALRAYRLGKPLPVSIIGFIKVISSPSHFPVSLAEPDVIRIAWRGGHSNWAAPSLKRVLPALGAHVTIAEPADERRGDWREWDESQLDERIIELVESGARIEAVKLLVERRGYTTTDAHQFVKQLGGRV